MSQTIEDFYNDQSVLVTGATGFLGKVLIEKLLRECPSIRTIYVLLRPRGGQDSQSRLRELLDSEIFATIRSKNISSLNKVKSVSGDITSDLNLIRNPSEEREVIENVSIVIHSAATIRFDEPLRRAININVDGTNRVLQLCHKLKNLKALVHVSTAYCNVVKQGIQEKVYLEPVAVQKVIEISKWMNDDTLEMIADQLYNGRPSSYHYTKALAENLLYQEGNNMSIAIVRPSIITASWKDPTPGWIDNYNGPSGFLVSSGKGVLRTMHVHGDKICDMIPVDIVANTLITSAWFVANKAEKGTTVINCTSGSLNPINWDTFQNISHGLLIKHPSIQLFRYPGASFHSNRIVHEFFLLLEHYIPAFVVDLLFKLTGHKPILNQVYQKVHRAMNALEYFTTNEWTFKNENFKQLMQSLNQKDFEKFSIDVQSINWCDYIENYVLGVRKYLLKEEPRTLPKARANLKRLYLITQMLKLGLLVTVTYQSLNKKSSLHRSLEIVRKLSLKWTPGSV
ncbi:putative fatty acyl-CoA reductase CG5065 [Tetranychus urticae]|uniref:putative fatty acyl-CoA reductase CG5065 n=1 Tax=Tetranychus urticae TaxID=32264 RepID=UPI00077BBDF7|nr:putative fatty acyl-CoA reductase CG5065 [Tetranychus urticae]XP_015793650.1 putative fatty acyl-CoA reductase CG5065 [Tetranychus urticae]XP_015793651.1 putative fatty acyl-CoA reductase CG5065 [Tetranychus urticae]XP_015793652.1 putative fatty acyl-CoA reductase CG5065 [Tetranychus urticae]